MILRRVIAHFRKQEWTAVALDFVIVVVGVFIGIQVANWNDGRAEYRKETKALVELKKELETSIVTAHARSHAYQQATEAGRRSLAFIDAKADCGEDCWDVVVDFMHASQWQDLNVTFSAYQNMRDQGFPKNSNIVDAVEAYRLQNINNATTFDDLPVYRSLVRQIIDLPAQEFYWAHCWSLVNGIEQYNLDCPEGISNDDAKGLVNEVVSNPNIKPHLTEWIGQIVSLPQTLGDQNAAAQHAVDIINEELERR